MKDLLSKEHYRDKIQIHALLMTTSAYPTPTIGISFIDEDGCVYVSITWNSYLSGRIGEWVLVSDQVDCWWEGMEIL